MPMIKRFAMAAALLLVAAPARPDVWDVQTTNDNTVATENELVHGSDQMHDLAPIPTGQDLDYYRLGQRPYSSWEVIVDATSADISSSAGIGLQRVAADGTVLLSSIPVTASINFSQSLRWQNATSNTVVDQYVKVFSTSCTTQCGADDVYRIRTLETTYAISRFNNVGNQGTVVVIQNAAPYQVNGNLFFWSATGTLLTFQAFSLPAKALTAVNTVPILDEQSGSITVTNNGRYGDLAGKAVSLETGTGYSFDTPMVPRPN
jgi:hypothetical protein